MFLVSEVDKSEHPTAWNLLLVFRILILLAWISTSAVANHILLVIPSKDNHGGLVVQSFTTKVVQAVFVLTLSATTLAPLWILPARLFACRPMNKLEWAFLIPGVTILGFVCVRLLT